MSAARTAVLIAVAIVGGPYATLVVGLAMLCPWAGRQIDAFLRHRTPRAAT